MQLTLLISNSICTVNLKTSLSRSSSFLYMTCTVWLTAIPCRIAEFLTVDTEVWDSATESPTM